MNPDTLAIHVNQQEKHTLLPGQKPDGSYCLSVLLKRTYDFRMGGRCTRAQKDAAITTGDVHYGDPMNSTVKYETDFWPWKVATDVVFVGKAYAPGGRPQRQFLAGLAVNDRTKMLQVTGDRVARYRHLGGITFSIPEPIAVMELRYERAYGGFDMHSLDVPVGYPRNPLGVGFAIKASKASVDRMPLPNLESPDHTLDPVNLLCGEIEKWPDQPIADGFGYQSKYSYPRASLAGVMPADREVEQEVRQIYAEVLSSEQREAFEQSQFRDMDFRYFNGASPGLTFEFLKGDETIEMTNLTPDGSLTFRLPGETPEVVVDIGGGPEHPDSFLHSVVIRGDDGQVDLVWRAAIDYPGPDWLPQMKQLDIEVR